jgi:hypothetical protein
VETLKYYIYHNTLATPGGGKLNETCVHRYQQKFNKTQAQHRIDTKVHHNAITCMARPNLLEVITIHFFQQF